MQIRKSFTFEAAHTLPHHPGKCARLHGHSYRLDVSCEGPLQASGPATGMIEDFDAISRIVKAAVINQVDHRSLDELLENPTAERIIIWIWQRLEHELPGLAQLTLWETSRACVVLKRGDPLTGTG